MGPIRSRAINSHLARASLTCEEKYKNLGSGVLINGCSFKPKYLMIASVSIMQVGEDSMEKLLPLCQEGSQSGGNFGKAGKVAQRFVNLFHTKRLFSKRVTENTPKNELACRAASRLRFLT